MTRDTAAFWSRVNDVVTVILISVAALSSAWCGYQAARWSGLSTLSYNLANGARVAASTAQTRSTIAELAQVSLFVQYEGALYSQNRQFAAFLYRRFPPELRRSVDAWLATKPLTNPRAPLSPFAMPQYHRQDDDVFAASTSRAETLIGEAVDANAKSEAYVFLTVICASISFLGGIATKMVYPRYLPVTIIGTVLWLGVLASMLRAPVR